MTTSTGSNLLAKLPAWLGFLALGVVGALMLANGLFNNDGAINERNELGFIIFGAAAIAISAVSWISGGSSQIKGSVGKVGVKVNVSDVPIWVWWTNLGIVVVSAALFFIATS